MLPAQIYGRILLNNEEHQEEIQQYNIERRIMRGDSDPFSLRDTQFIDLFRLTKNMVNYLKVTFMPHMSQTIHPSGVDPALRIFAALYFYATGSYQRTIGQTFQLSMAQNTVSKCIDEVTRLIVDHLAEEWIQFPQDFNTKLTVKTQFMEKYHFPGCIGAIDCTHVAIIAPVEEEHNYLNRKGFHSKNVQVICDANLKIFNVNAIWGGATHDAFIWRQSNIRRYLQACYNDGDHQSWLIGDSGYPQEPWLMTPILNAVPDSPEDRYTTAHILARTCIERCNGVLKARFRCLLGERVMRYNPVKCGQIITACAILHNICINGRLAFEEPPINVNDNNQYPPNANHAENGRDVRHILIQRYFT